MFNHNNDIARNIADTLATIADNINQGALAQHKTARLTEPETAHAEIEVMLAELAVVDNADLRSALYERIAQVAIEEMLCIREESRRAALADTLNCLYMEYGTESLAVDKAADKLAAGATGAEKDELEKLITNKLAYVAGLRVHIAEFEAMLSEEVD